MATANTTTNTNTNNTNIEQALNLLQTLTADIDFSKQCNGQIKQNAEQGFATLSEQTTEQGDKQFVIYNAHLANSQFLTAFHIRLNSDEEQAVADGIKHRANSNNKHNISQRANTAIEQLDEQTLALFNIKNI